MIFTIEGCSNSEQVLGYLQVPVVGSEVQGSELPAVIHHIDQLWLSKKLHYIDIAAVCIYVYMCWMVILFSHKYKSIHLPTA